MIFVFNNPDLKASFNPYLIRLKDYIFLCGADVCEIPEDILTWEPG
jgi:hypothetical protein